MWTNRIKNECTSKITYNIKLSYQDIVNVQCCMNINVTKCLSKSGISSVVDLAIHDNTSAKKGNLEIKKIFGGLC